MKKQQLLENKSIYVNNAQIYGNQIDLHANQLKIQCVNAEIKWINARIRLLIYQQTKDYHLGNSLFFLKKKIRITDKLSSVIFRFETWEDSKIS